MTYEEGLAFLCNKAQFGSGMYINDRHNREAPSPYILLLHHNKEELGNVGDALGGSTIFTPERSEKSHLASSIYGGEYKLDIRGDQSLKVMYDLIQIKAFQATKFCEHAERMLRKYGYVD